MRNVRNFWIEGSVDGRTSPISDGPRGKDGEFVLDLWIRDNGSARHAFTISGVVAGEALAIHCSKTDGLGEITVKGHR